jgi:hypothetical protein
MSYDLCQSQTKIKHIHKNINIHIFHADILSNIFQFVNLKEALALCFSCKYLYNNGIELCYKYTKITLNIKHNRICRVNYYNYINCIINCNMYTLRTLIGKNTHQQLVEHQQLPDYNSNIHKFKYLTTLCFGKSYKPKSIPPSSVNSGSAPRANFRMLELSSVPLDIFSNLRILKFDSSSEFNAPICRKNLPSFLNKIYFGKKYNHSIDNLPDSITFISFPRKSVFNKPIANLPQNLQEIYFGYKFNSALDMSNLYNLKSIIFCNNSIFNSNIILRPYQILEIIHFGLRFNRSIDSIISNVKKIYFTNKSEFNSIISRNSLSLVFIKFGITFNQSIFQLCSSPCLQTIKFYFKSRYLVDPQSKIELEQLKKKYRHIKLCNKM